MAWRHTLAVGGTLLWGMACVGTPAPSSTPLASVDTAAEKPEPEGDEGDAGAEEAVSEPETCDAPVTQEVADQVRERSRETGRCYEDQLRVDHCATGRMRVQMKVAASGATSDIRIEQRGFVAGEMSGCVESVFRSAHFPGLAGCAKLVVPLNFKPKESVDGCPSDEAKLASLKKAPKGPPECPVASISWLQNATASALPQQCQLGELEACQQSCGEQGMSGCLMLAESLFRGSGTDEDPKRAREILERSCAGGYFDACLRLGFEISKGKADKQAIERAMNLFSAACTAGNPQACGLLAYHYRALDGPGAKSCVVGLLEKICAADLYPSCVALAGELKDDRRAEALQLLQTTCDKGYQDACTVQGQTLLEGTSAVERKRGLEMLTSQCDANVCSACNALGYVFIKGNGAAKNPSKAVELFRKCCVPEYPNGCDSLAEAYREGWGVPASREKANEYYQKACEWGQERSCDRVEQATGKPTKP